MPVVKYIWDVVNDSYLMETDENDATTAAFTVEPGQGGRLISQRRDAADSYYHFDAQGSTRQLTDADEVVSDSYDFTAFGETAASSVATTNAFRYVGELGYYHDPELADYYVRARTYDPVGGRFISRDPIGVQGTRWESISLCEKRADQCL